MASHTCCKDCKKETGLIFDHITGNTICSECGLLLFSSFSGKENSTSSSLQLNQVPPQSTQCDDRLKSGLSEISNMAEKLNLVGTIKNRAKEIYKKYDNRTRSSRKARKRASVLAACLYIACNRENLPLTLKEICSVSNGATKIEIGRSKTEILKIVVDSEVDKNNNNGGVCGRTSSMAEGRDFVKRFCSNLGISGIQTMRAAQETARVSMEELDVRRTPVSVAATVIYIISQLLGENSPSVKEICAETGVSEVTIRSTYRELYPHLGKIVPSWYASEVDISNLGMYVVGEKKKEDEINNMQFRTKLTT